MSTGESVYDSISTVGNELDMDPNATSCIIPLMAEIETMNLT